MRSFIAVLVVAMIYLFVCVDSTRAAGGIGLSDHWDLGDINGGYSTSYYTWGTEQQASMYANLGGNHGIDGITVFFGPNWSFRVNPDGTWERVQDGYRMNASFWGNITNPLTSDRVGYNSQSDRFDARGIILDLFASTDIYNFDGDMGLELQAYGSASFNINNFKVNSASGNYREWNYTDDEGNATPTYFDYNIQWQGDFLPGTVPAGMMIPEMSAMAVSSAAQTPEPSAFALIASGAFGLAVVVWRRKRK